MKNPTHLSYSPTNGVLHSLFGRLGGSFRCPWPSANQSIWRELCHWPFVLRKPTEGDARCKPITVTTPSFSPNHGDRVLAEVNSRSIETWKTRATWLGHASALVQYVSSSITVNDINVLCDPMFSHRASPFANFGPKRHLPAPCNIEDLPRIDAVCISHNHYDHLDIYTIAKLVKLDTAKCTLYFVPLGCGKTLIKAGVSPHQIREKDWWEEETLYLEENRAIRVICTPAQHNSSRNLFDLNETLWCGWIVQHEISEGCPSTGTKGVIDKEALATVNFALRQTVSSVFFGGDTGYRAFSDGPVCPAFKELGERYGPFDLAFIPIWRGGVLSCLSKLGLRLKSEAWTRKSHCTPQDAVDVHRDLRARTSIAIHHSTFVGEDEAQWSIQLLKQACDMLDRPSVQFERHCGNGQENGGEVGEGGRFVVLDIGGTVCV